MQGELGRGGMGVVYGAFDPVLERKVALKVIQLDPFADASEHAEFAARFLREMRATSGLFHENVVATFDAGLADCEGGPEAYYVMEWVPGISLDKKLQQCGTLDPAVGLRIAAQIARGLGAVHAAGRIHRDLKPSNVILPDTGGAKIADFGLCKFRNEHTILTSPGAIVGSPNYLAPEQVLGAKVSETADLFSLGAMLVRMLTGVEPFAANALDDHFKRVLFDEPDGLDRLAPRVRKLVEPLLSKDPRDRPSCATEVASRLEALAESRCIASPMPSRYRGLRPVVAVLAAFALFLPVSGWKEPAQRPIVRVHDAGAPLQMEQRESLSERLALFYRESGVDARFRIESPPDATPLDAFATARFEQLDVGSRSPRGRGILFLYDPRAEELRIEVSYGLEAILSDALLGRLIEEHAGYLFESSDPATALGLAIRMLEDRLRYAQMIDQFETRPTDARHATRYASGGAGARGAVRSRYSDGDRWGTHGEPMRFSAGGTAREAYDEFVRWLSSPRYEPNVELFTRESQAFLANFPMTPGYLAYLFELESVEDIEIHQRGDRAIALCSSSPFIAPHLLRRTEAGWQVDIVAEVEEVVSIAGSAYSWSFRNTQSPWLVPLADEIVRVGGVIRLRGGDNRPLVPFRSSL